MTRRDDGLSRPWAPARGVGRGPIRSSTLVAATAFGLVATLAWIGTSVLTIACLSGRSASAPGGSGGGGWAPFADGTAPPNPSSSCPAAVGEGFIAFVVSVPLGFLLRDLYRQRFGSSAG